MADNDKLIAEVAKKIEREKALIHAASNLRQSTENAQVHSRVDAQVRDGRKNISYLEEKMRELELRRYGGDNGPPTPSHGGPNQRLPGNGPGPVPIPPPKDSSGYFRGVQEAGGYGHGGPGGYNDGNANLMPSGAQFRDHRPFAPVPKARPNYSKLGACIMLLMSDRLRPY